MARPHLPLTKALTEVLKRFPLYSQEKLGDDALVVAKFFSPRGRFTLFVTEGQPLPGGDYRFFGWAVSPLGPDCDEYGYSLLSEILAAGCERDKWFLPLKHTVAECRDPRGPSVPRPAPAPVKPSPVRLPTPRTNPAPHAPAPAPAQAPATAITLYVAPDVTEGQAAAFVKELSKAVANAGGHLAVREVVLKKSDATPGTHHAV